MARSMLGIRCIRSSQSLEFRELLVARKPKLLSDMFHDTLKDVYFAENKILKTLPKMAKAAQSKELKAAFVKHERETRGHVKRLEGVFKILGKPARAKTCDAILGITKEGAEVMTEYAALSRPNKKNIQLQTRARLDLTYGSGVVPSTLSADCLSATQ